MLFKANLATNKTEYLAENYLKLINSGIHMNEILVILPSSSKRSIFQDMLFEHGNFTSFSSMKIYSFFGLVFNALVDNWAFVENSINIGETSVLPNTVGLEFSQYVMKDLLKDIKFKGYNSKKSLLHQLFRRYSLIVQNSLSEVDVDKRSAVLNEPFADDAKIFMKSFLSKTLELRSFDYLRQTLIFKHIYSNTDYFKNIKYLIVDDADEMTPACFEFIKFLAPQLKDYFIAVDELGSSRSGYLSADSNIYSKLKQIFQEDYPNLNSIQNKKADILFHNVLEKANEIVPALSLISVSKRAQMIDKVCERINDLIKKGCQPKDISIISPVYDDMLRFSLSEKIKLANLKFLSGSEKLIQNKLVLSVLNILKYNAGFKLSEFDVRVIVSGFLGIPIKYCKCIIDNFRECYKFEEYEFEQEEYNEKYNRFLSVLNHLEDKVLSEKVCFLFEQLVDSVNPALLVKFNFLVKQLRDFERVYIDDSSIIVQLENSIISENPYQEFSMEENDLIVATPQKIIDNQVRTKYQFWLDISSSEWIKSDTGPMYNAWVFQADWNKSEYTIDDEILLSTQKNARILRKLALLCDEIIACSSLFDSQGVENYGGIENFLAVNAIAMTKSSTCKPIVPREDQKPVLEYKSGKMAISAVPGAGKTTILLALILKLIENNIDPENIFVLTYMESAARNFRERIKNIYQDSSKMPNISTIHGLSLRILKENSNFERLGLSSDFEICDDSQKSKIIKDIVQKLKLKKTEADEFERAVSVLKLSQGNVDISVDDKKMNSFLNFYKEYCEILSQNNLIDYDDMLVSSVRLLEENEDVLKYYQNVCEYIIEDEAQDSSEIQQRLINLLSGKHGNLIRCGDINQAITTTFSNADVEGFRDFISSSKNVSMNCSQRCCEDVWKLANKLVDFAERSPETEKSFYKMFMHPVEGRNPVSDNALKACIFKNSLEEKNFVLKTIKSLLAKNPKSTIAILLRNNFQVATWMKFIDDAGLKAITRSESLEQKGVFKVIYAFLNIVLKPFDNDVIADSYEILAENGFYKPRLQVEIRNLKSPFVQIDADMIQSPELGQFYWDVAYWLSFSYLSIYELATKIGLYYYSSDIEKSNVYLISTLIKRIANTNSDFNYVMERLAELSKKPSLSGFKFFAETDESDNTLFEGKVQIMTMHKSKGDEFDYVFLPELTEKALTLDFSQLNLKSSSDFMEKVRALNSKYTIKSDFEMKKFLIAENLRLLYVAITRAKYKLYFSVASKTKSFGKEVTQEPNIIFSTILSDLVESES